MYKIFQRQAPDKLGEGAVLSVGLFGVTFLVTLAQFLLLERRVHYGTVEPAEARRRRHRRRRPVGQRRLVRSSSAVLSLLDRPGPDLLPVRAGHLRPEQAFTSSVLTPQGVRFDGFSQAWDRGNLGGALLRSLVVTVAITGLQVVTSVLAAYAFAFLRFPFKPVVFAVFMATLLLPLEVTLLPNLQTMRELGWFDSYQGLIVPFAAAAFGTFLIRQGFLGIPDEIRDAARLEGWGHLQFLCRFAVPLTRPVIASFTVIAFIGAFNQYLWPRAVITDTAELGHDPDRPARPHQPHRAVQHPRRRRGDRRRARSSSCSSCSSATSSAASPPAR